MRFSEGVRGNPCYVSLKTAKKCVTIVLDVTAIFFGITAFLKKLPFLAKGLQWCVTVAHINTGLDIKQFGPLAQGASRFEKLLVH